MLPESNRRYEAFLRATLGLIDASAACAPCLARPRRIVMDAAILRVCEADHTARSVLLDPEPRRLERAAALLEQARALLADAGSEATVDLARRRSFRLVA